MTFKEYVRENWDGWPLHSLISAGIMYVGWHYPMEALLVFNTYFWPNREADQHDGWQNIWTFHRILEWGCPIVVGIGMYVVLR